MKWDLFVTCKLVLSRNIACTAAAITMFVLDVCKLLFLNVCHPTELLRVKTAQQKCHKYENCTGFNPFKTFLPANLTDCVEILFRSFSFVVNCWGEQSWSFNKAVRWYLERLLFWVCIWQSEGKYCIEFLPCIVFPIINNQPGWTEPPGNSPFKL